MLFRSNKSKFIPVTEESLTDCHYKAAKDILTMYYEYNPDSDLLTGKGLVIGGSHTINPLNQEAQYGDLSAVLLQNSPFWGHWIRTPDLSIALMDEWESKIEKLAASRQGDAGAMVTAHAVHSQGHHGLDTCWIAHFGVAIKQKARARPSCDGP